MLRRRFASVSSATSFSSSSVGFSSCRFPSSSSSSKRPPSAGRKTSDSSGGHSAAPTTVSTPDNSAAFFVSQRGALFFTDETFSTVREIKNTLVVPPGSKVISGKSKKGGKEAAAAAAAIKGKKAGGATTTGGTNTDPLGQGAAQLRIAMMGRTLRTFSHHQVGGGAPPPRLFSWDWFTSFAFLEGWTSSSRMSELKKASEMQKQRNKKRNQPAIPANFSRRKWWYSVMPDGFPYSIRDSQGFVRFFVLNIVGCFLASFSLTLATQSLLASFFASGTSVGWLLKDILPAFATAYLAHTFITVERHPREWFIVANVLTQSAVCFDFAIPHIAAALGDARLLVPLASMTSFVKGLAMLVLTTSRTALVQSFSREGNLVELTKRLQGMLIVTYPLASGVALAVAGLFSLASVSIAGLVCMSSLGCIAVSVSLVRRLYPRLLNTECAVESCRRFIAGNPVIRCAEAPSVALFHRNVFSVPFQIGFSLSKAVAAARRTGEILTVVTFNDSVGAPDAKPCKYLFVFRKERPAGRKMTADQQQQQQQEAFSAPVVDYGDGESSVQDLSPDKFVGVLYDVSATFTDVMEGVYAALMFMEPRGGGGARRVAGSADHHQHDHDGGFAAGGSGSGGGGGGVPERRFLKRPAAHDVHSLVAHMQGAGWQVRAHQIDNRDQRIEITAATFACGAAEAVATAVPPAASAVLPSTAIPIVPEKKSAEKKSPASVKSKRVAKGASKK